MRAGKKLPKSSYSAETKNLSEWWALLRGILIFFKSRPVLSNPDIDFSAAEELYSSLCTLIVLLRLIICTKTKKKPENFLRYHYHPQWRDRASEVCESLQCIQFDCFFLEEKSRQRYVYTAYLVCVRIFFTSFLFNSFYFVPFLVISKHVLLLLAAQMFWVTMNIHWDNQYYIYVPRNDTKVRI